jgi:hypothetical protein
MSHCVVIIDEQKKRELEEQRLKILEFLLTEPGIFEVSLPFQIHLIISLKGNVVRLKF